MLLLLKSWWLEDRQSGRISKLEKDATEREDRLRLRMEEGGFRGGIRRADLARKQS